MNDINHDTMEQKIINILKRAKRISISYIIIVLIFASPYIILQIFRYGSGPARGGGEGALMLIGFILGLILFISGQIRYHVFTLKIYKILLKSETTDLPVKDVSIGWWFVPFMNIYKPYQVLRDVYSFANLSVGMKNKHLLDVRRISIFSSFLLSFEGFCDGNFEAIFGRFGINVILNIFIYFISSGFIIFKLRKLYKIYLDNQQRE